MLAPRPYQQRALDEVRAAFARGSRAPLVVAPTGAGKTAIAALAVAGHIAKRPDAMAVVVVPRLELAAQTRDTLTRAGVRAGIIAGDAAADVVDADAPAQVATIQTLLARGPWWMRPVSFVVLDEAHHYVSAEWFDVVERLRAGVPALGLTATPCRADGAALGALFDHLVVAATVRGLTNAGHLVPCDVIAPPQRQSGLAEHPDEAWWRYASEPGDPDPLTRRTIVFARDQAHAQAICERFAARGVAVAFIDASLSSAERAKRIADFRAGRLTVLVNCQILTEGFDDPSVECVILASGCAHTGSYLQKVGRALRPSPTTGKERALVIDLCGAVHDHGLPDDPREYSLAGKAIGTPDDVLALRQCPECGGCYRAEQFADSACPRCGFVLPGRPDPRIARAKLDAIRATHTSDRRADALRELYRKAAERGYKRGWAHSIFLARYKRHPNSAEISAASR